jgi:hypothetical protein
LRKVWKAEPIEVDIKDLIDQFVEQSGSSRSIIEGILDILMSTEISLFRAN